MDNLPLKRLLSDSPHTGNWYVFVHYFGAKNGGTIATFPMEDEAKALQFFEETLAKAQVEERIKEVYLGHERPRVGGGRESCFARWFERARRKGKFVDMMA